MTGGAGGPRGAHGMVWAIGPEVSTLQPFTNTITGVFSIFLRSGWSDVTHTLNQNLTSFGSPGVASWGLKIVLAPGVGGSDLSIFAYDMVGTAARNQIHLGDEDGVSRIQADKWYQVAFSMSASAFSYCVNGSTTPKATVVSSTFGDLNLDYGNERWWYHNGVTANSGRRTVLSNEQLLVTSGWPTFIVGAAAWSTTYVDWTDATARARVFDTDGNFKNPGENGSLWFGDTYSSVIPDFFFLDGSPRIDNGSYNATIPQSWQSANGGGAGSTTSPGGLRKQYEVPFPDDWWIYATLALAEASGDTWIDGDTIYCASTAGLFIYKSVLAVSGYSGLIHKYPFGYGNGILSAVSLKGSETANSDPDTWSDLGTKTAIGTQGVDYELDTNGGVSRLRAITDASQVAMESSYILTSADVEVFRIIDLTEFHTADGGLSDQSTQHVVRAYIDASNYSHSRILPFGSPNTPWAYEYGTEGLIANLNRTRYSNVPARAWLYAKAGRFAVWFDGDGSVSNDQTTPATIAGSSIPIAKTRVGSAASTGDVFTMHMGTDVFGSMTTI